jgi:cell division protein FtsL
MNVADKIGQLIERLVMLVFVLTGLSVALALNYVMWKGLVNSDFSNVQELRLVVNAQQEKISKMEQEIQFLARAEEVE